MHVDQKAESGGIDTIHGPNINQKPFLILCLQTIEYRPQIRRAVQIKGTFQLDYSERWSLFQNGNLHAGFWYKRDCRPASVFRSLNPMLLQSQRRRTREVKVGDVGIGGSNPVRIQTMTIADTMNTLEVVEETIACYQAGAEIVRITAPGWQDAQNLGNIKAELLRRGCPVPLVADIHFSPRAALIAVEHVEKVRINPGNFLDEKKFKKREYTDLEYEAELDRLHQGFKELVLKARQYGRALRIGTNHGSLSDRIMNRYGDTPQGMVESALEFIDIARVYDFHELVISMKASSVAIMVEAYRLLVERFDLLGYDYPLHLGVTESGEGREGRIKSIIGIGSLLLEGIGDTIRVSLTEKSVNEIPVAQALLRATDSCAALPLAAPSKKTRRLPAILKKKQIVVARQVDAAAREHVDYILADQVTEIHPENKTITRIHHPRAAGLHVSDFDSPEIDRLLPEQFLLIEEIDTGHARYPLLRDRLIHTPLLPDRPESYFLLQQATANHDHPVLVDCSHFAPEIHLPLLAGSLLLRGHAQGLIADDAHGALDIFQALRLRLFKPDYISCPGCGRTLFELQSTTRLIKDATAHLKGLKIAIMGCIVNGPGEMADADYGYVGAGPGKIHLYRGRDMVKKNIATAEALRELIELIRTDGHWQDPPR